MVQAQVGEDGDDVRPQGGGEGGDAHVTDDLLVPGCARTQVRTGQDVVEAVGQR